MIDVVDLHKSFGDINAVQGVSFTARDGEITGLLGPNGAGKTTTLRMLYTLLAPDSGTIAVDGADPVADAVAVRRLLGVVPDSRGLYQRLTARENIRYFARLHGLDKAVMEARLAHLVEALDMAAFIDRRTGGFSQGQRVKVAIARALIHQPKNILLDEPSNGLDVMSTRALRTFIRNLKNDGHCVIFSSHIMQEVAELCDRIVIISHGRVVANGTPTELLAEANESSLEDAFVALIGSQEGLLA